MPNSNKRRPTKMGIDFGIKNTVFLAFNNIDNYYAIKTAPVVKETRRLIKYMNEPYQYIDMYNYKTAQFIVNIALKHYTSIIQMEDLTNTSFTRNSFYFDLQRQVQQRATENGIIAKYVNRDFTSQKCSRCGFIHKDNRLNQRQFVCVSCGYSSNADYNAAKNICNII